MVHIIHEQEWNERECITRKAENLATVLAALRLFQRTYDDQDADAILRDWPEHFIRETKSTVPGAGIITPLSTEDIDTLCDMLNAGQARKVLP